MMPDERQLTKGISSTDVPAKLQAMVDSLVGESTRMEDEYVGNKYIVVTNLSFSSHRSTGVCLEYLLKNGALSFVFLLAVADFSRQTSLAFSFA